MTNAARELGRRAGVILLLFCCASCVSAGDLADQQAAAPFDPALFFTGRTEGRAVLKIALHRPQTILVEGTGRVDAHGGITLDQSVRAGNGPAKQRTWHLHPDGNGGWAGTLSDAAGPVHGRVDGNCLHLTFAMRGGLSAQQWLYLQPGGAILRNVMVVRKWAMPVARLDEMITRLPPP